MHPTVHYLLKDFYGRCLILKPGCVGLNIVNGDSVPHSGLQDREYPFRTQQGLTASYMDMGTAQLS